MMDLLLSGGAGFIAGMVPYALMARKLWNLQCDLASVKVQLLKERNTRAADTRWKDKALLDEFEQAKTKPEQTPGHFPQHQAGLAKFKRV